MGRKTLEVEGLKKNGRLLHSQTSQVDPDYYTALTTELKKDGISIKDVAEILLAPRSRFYPRSRKSKKTPKPKQNYVSDKELSAAIKMACNRYPLYGYRRISV